VEGRVGGPERRAARLSPTGRWTMPRGDDVSANARSRVYLLIINCNSVAWLLTCDEAKPVPLSGGTDTFDAPHSGLDAYRKATADAALRDRMTEMGLSIPR